MILWSHKTIKKAGVLIETASDDGTVHDNRVADTTRVVSLIITDEVPKVKSSCITSRKGQVVLFSYLLAVNHSSISKYFP